MPFVAAGLATVYLSLTAAVVWLLRRLAKSPPETEVGGDLGAGA